MIFTAKIEQTYAYPKANEIYCRNGFIYRKGLRQPFICARSAPAVHGWIKESGTPPQPHLDVIVMTDDEYELGDEVQVRVVGVFRRSDGDHKFVGVPESREVNDFTELTESEISDMNRLYRKKA